MLDKPSTQSIKRSSNFLPILLNKEQEANETLIVPNDKKFYRQSVNLRTLERGPKTFF